MLIFVQIISNLTLHKNPNHFANKRNQNQKHLVLIFSNLIQNLIV